MENKIGSVNESGMSQAAQRMMDDLILFNFAWQVDSHHLGSRDHTEESEYQALFYKWTKISSGDREAITNKLLLEAQEFPLLWVKELEKALRSEKRISAQALEKMERFFDIAKRNEDPKSLEEKVWLLLAKARLFQLYERTYEEHEARMEASKANEEMADQDAMPVTTNSIEIEDRVAERKQQAKSELESPESGHDAMRSFLAESSFEEEVLKEALRRADPKLHFYLRTQYQILHALDKDPGVKS
ncbi:MAG: hypothetical protein Q7N87_03840 [Candidatus Uhrbacteria bacterium]|nr:hypothetical protein [Candidatus Uhrbacteria bacterium]MDP3793912.1 hypothetical protein [Candidatus Uhrbacteria bacterium]